MGDVPNEKQDALQYARLIVKHHVYKVLKKRLMPERLAHVPVKEKEYAIPAKPGRKFYFHMGEIIIPLTQAIQRDSLRLEEALDYLRMLNPLLKIHADRRRYFMDKYQQEDQLTYEQAKRRFEEEWPRIVDLIEFSRIELFAMEEVQRVAELKRGADAQGIPETDQKQPRIKPASFAFYPDEESEAPEYSVGARIGVFF
ncbi:MAG: hypothetical protein ABW189_06420 [Rickettsiales bacterium]